MMQTPKGKDLDRMLQGILKSKRIADVEKGNLVGDDRAFAEVLLDKINDGAKGLLIVIEEDGGVSYLIANDTRLGAVETAARWIKSTVRYVQECGGGDE